MNNTPPDEEKSDTGLIQKHKGLYKKNLNQNFPSSLQATSTNFT